MKPGLGATTLAATIVTASVVIYRVVTHVPEPLPTSSHENGEAASGPAPGAHDGNSDRPERQIERIGQDSSFDADFLRELELLLNGDPAYAKIVEANQRLGDADRLAEERSRLGDSLERLKTAGARVPLPDESQIWAMDGAALNTAASLLAAHANNCSAKTAKAAAGKMRVLFEEGHDYAIRVSPEAIAELHTGAEIPFNQPEHFGLANALAEARDSHVMQYATTQEKYEILRGACFLASRRAGFQGNFEELDSVLRELCPELVELQEELSEVSRSYYAATTGLVIEWLPEGLGEN